MKKLTIALLILAAAYFVATKNGLIADRIPSISHNNGQSAKTLPVFGGNQASGSQIQGGGVVKRVLPDDNIGSRHQRFIVQLDSGQTLLIAHNIDVARRVEPLNTGDRLQFAGEYEWNEKGGVVHWTHHDPAGRHPAGWLRINGQTYQ
jgi:hypothetical protein